MGQDLLSSLVRTYVPVLVGFIVSAVASLGIGVNTDERGFLVSAMTGAITLVYYTAVRLLERKWPQLGVLLGSVKQPIYVPGNPSQMQAAQVPEAPGSAPPIV